MNQAAIALGSNIRPDYYIPEAVRRLQEGIRILSRSEFMTTRPVGFSRQPDFVNGVVLVETDMDRSELEAWLHGVEDAPARGPRQARKRQT